MKGKKVDEIVADKQQRYAVMSSKLRHTNLAVIHYSVFFQTCRALGTISLIKIIHIFYSNIKVV